MLKNCGDNQRLLMAFDAKLNESGLGELASKPAEDSRVRVGSVSNRRDRVRALILERPPLALASLRCLGL